MATIGADIGPSTIACPRDDQTCVASTVDVLAISDSTGGAGPMGSDSGFVSSCIPWTDSLRTPCWAPGLCWTPAPGGGPVAAGTDLWWWRLSVEWPSWSARSMSLPFLSDNEADDSVDALDINDDASESEAMS